MVAKNGFSLATILLGSLLFLLASGVQARTSVLKLVENGSLEDFKEKRRSEMGQRRQDFATFVEERSEAYQQFYERRKEAFRKFKEKIASAWGKENVDVSTKKTMTEYEEDLSSRYSVDFEEGSARAEVLVPAEQARDSRESVREKLKKQVRTMVTDQSVEDEIAEETDDDSQKDGKKKTTLDEAVLADQVRTSAGDVVNEKNADDFAERTVESDQASYERVEGEDGRERVKASVTVKLIPEHTRQRAQEYLREVRNYADKFELTPELVLALMHTESYFNPKARSSVPAYGLMQLVPSTGGKAAYKHLYERERLLEPSYLYQPENNIELGTGYLNLLYFNYLDGIKDSTSRTYCAIAAYNTGPGNLAKTFVGNTSISRAETVINGMSADEVYDELRRSLPYEETRKYIKKVRKRRVQYERWLDEGTS